MEKSPTYQVYVGSAGWEHPEWNGHFYPDGLPPEWRLAYYNTVFPCVYLPYPAWSRHDLQTLSGWVEDTQERFRFVLEASPAGLADEDRSRLEVLAPRIVSGVDALSDERVVWLERSPDLKKLADKLQGLAASPCPVYLISPDHNLEAMNQALTLLEVMGA